MKYNSNSDVYEGSTNRTDVYGEKPASNQSLYGPACRRTCITEGQCTCGKN